MSHARKRQVTPPVQAAPQPSVSICTITCNRAAFLPLLQACVASQTYPHELIEWVIVDDSDNGEPPFAADPQLDIRVKHIQLDKRLMLGHKRNLSHEHCTGEIIVYMDDDDYYPPQRVQHAVERLLETKQLVAGATMLPIYFTDTGQAWLAGPYHNNHATANTFAFRRELLQQTRYEDSATHGEEKAFLKNYQIPMAQLDPVQTILCMGHSHNTFDKRRLIQGGNNPKMRKLMDMPEQFISINKLNTYAKAKQAQPQPSASALPQAQTAIGNQTQPKQKAKVSAWYINRRQDRARRIQIESQQHWLPDNIHLERLNAITPEWALRQPEYAFINLLNPLRQAQYCIVLSHLYALESFVNFSDATHAIILEDDIDLSSMQHWGFDLNQLAEAMPSNSGIVQLCVIWSASASAEETTFLIPQEMHCHNRRPGEYSTAAYLANRTVGEEIVRFFKPLGLNFFNLFSYSDADMIIADHLLYDSIGLGHSRPTLCLPIFNLLNEELGILIKRSGHSRMHQASRLFMQDYLQSAAPLQLNNILPRTQP